MKVGSKIQVSKTTITNALLALLGLLFLYMAFRNQDPAALWEQLQQVNYWWGLPVLATTIFNHLMRAARWRLLINTIKPNTAFSATFLSLMTGYLVNLAVPRLGEISRCLSLYKTQKVPVPAALGTVVTERAIDILMLAIVLLSVVFLQFGLMINLYQTHLAPVLHPAIAAFQFSGLWLLALLLFILMIAASIWLVVVFLKENVIYQKFRHFLANLWKGIFSIVRLPQKGLFLILTAGIWFTYLFMTWLWFYSLPQTAHLSFSVAWALLAIGGVGRSLPIQGGGLGAYHFLVAQTLLVFGVAELYGTTLAIVIHAFQMLFYLLAGSLSALYISLARKSRSATL